MRRKLSPAAWMVAGLLTLVLLAAAYVIMPQLRPTVTIHLGDGVFEAKVARTTVERQTGLSNSSGLSVNQAMLFVFDDNQKWSIWMKDMNFPIDIVWLDQNQRIIYIVKNADPSSYPKEIFTPKDDARYVIEVPAGTVDRRAIMIGQQAGFDLNQLEGIQ